MILRSQGQSNRVPGRNLDDLGVGRNVVGVIDVKDGEVLRACGVKIYRQIDLTAINGSVCLKNGGWITGSEVYLVAYIVNLVPVEIR